MIQKKICMLGSFAVGKTSLVARYVRSIFSEKYHSTVGVKIDKKVLEIDNKTVNLILWDLYGEDQFQQMQTSYLRGSSGYLLVADGTRANTIDTAISLQERTKLAIGNVPFILLINKADIKNNWEIADDTITALIKKGWAVLETSAKTGRNVEEAFQGLAKRILE